MITLYPYPIPSPGLPNPANAGGGAPVLVESSPAPSAALTWTWGGTLPDHWRLEISNDGVTWPSGFSDLNSGVNTVSVTSGLYYRIFGVDAGENAVTGISNTIFTA